MSEADYRAQAPALAAQLSGPHVRGVYEERMPLALEAALQLGCVVGVAPAMRRKALGATWQLEDLQVWVGDGVQGIGGPAGMGRV